MQVKMIALFPPAIETENELLRESYASPSIRARTKTFILEQQRVAARSELSSCFCYGLHIYGLHICLPGGASNCAKDSARQPGNDR
jgi:hypothetical protein